MATRTTTYERDGVRYRITAEAIARALGNQAAYFSLTGTIDERRGNRWTEYSGGAIHDEIVKHFPELAPVALVHLSRASDGYPMHCVENGLYWLGLLSIGPDDDYGRRALETDQHGTWAPQTAADHFRCTLTDVRALRSAVIDRMPRNDARDRPMLRAVLGEELARIDMPARWQAQADAANAVINAGDAP